MNTDKLIKAINRKYQYDEITGYFLRRSRWRDEEAGSVACGLNSGSGYKYISVKVDGKQINIRAHRAAFLLIHGYFPEVVDHINGKKTDNRIVNLREATHHQNSFNTKGVFTRRGVRKEINGTFTAHIRKTPYQYNLGNYATEAEAATAYNIGARQMHGEFATTNTIDEVAGVTIEPRKIGCGVGRRLARHDDVVKQIKQKTKLCYFTGDISRIPHGYALKHKSTLKRWQTTNASRKKLFQDNEKFRCLGVNLTKSEVVHAHQYGFLPKKVSKTKRKKLDLSDTDERARFKKNRLTDIKYNPTTGIFTRKGVNIKQKKCKQGYKSIKIGRNNVLSHRLAYLIVHDEWPEVVDHINNDRSDNRISNLRAATKEQNAMNRKSQRGSTSKYKGVSWNKEKKKWQATCNKKFLGRFNNEKDAAQAYNKEAKKQHGEFAYINKI